MYVRVWTSLEAQRWSIHLPVEEMGFWSLGQEGPLEKEMSTHSSVVAREIVHGVAKRRTWLND